MDILRSEHIIVISYDCYGYPKVRIYCSTYHMTVMDILK